MSRAVSTFESRSFLIAALAICSAAVVVSCSATDPKLVPLPAKKEEKIVNTGEKFNFNPKVDILFVVDDSGSMESKQANLIHNIQLFTAGLAANQIMDYHIGVLTSSYQDFQKGAKGGDGLLVGPPYYVDRQTPNALQALSENLHVGTSGSGTEKFFAPVMAALSQPLVTGANAGFYRDDAHLAVIFITDANDQSPNVSAQDFYDFLVGLKHGDKAKIISYGIIIPSTDTVCDRSSEDPPVKTEEYMRIAGGTVFGLCDIDYGQKLAGLAIDLGKRVGRIMYLSRAPDVSTIVVTYGSATLPNDPKTGWIFDPLKNALIFGTEIDWKSQPIGSQVEVNFTAAQY